MQNEIDFTDSPSSDRLSGSAIEWFGRSYESMEEWKAKAGNVYFSSNGDSNLSRNRVASIVRAYFLETVPAPEDVVRWKPGYEGKETIAVSPPNVTPSNSAYVDWLYIADYLLLACASTTIQLDEENQRRETEFQNVSGSYKIRLIVHDARDEMRRDANLTDDQVLTSVQKQHSKAAMANVKEARRLEKANMFHSIPKQPILPQPMPRYSALYF